RPRQATPKREIGMRTDCIAQRSLENAFRSARAEPLGADAPEVPMDRGDEFPEPVEARFAPVNHLVENGLAQFLVVRREAMLHLNLNCRRPDVPDALEEGVEVRDVEVDHLTKGAPAILQSDFHPQMLVPATVTERGSVVGSAVYRS